MSDLCYNSVPSPLHTVTKSKKTSHFPALNREQMNKDIVPSTSLALLEFSVIASF